MKTNKLSMIPIHVILIAICIAILVPFAAIVSISFSNESDITNYGYSLIPKNFAFTGYKYILDNPTQLINSYKVTVVSSLVGVVIYMTISSRCAYSLSRSSFSYRRVINFILFFTLLFNGGLVPTYMLMTQYLKVNNSYQALVIPLLSNVWYMFIIRTFFKQLPEALIEAAKIDGAGELKIFARIIIPLSKPVMATIALLQLLNYWNSWHPALLYISKEEMYPLQYLLQVMLRNMQEVMLNIDRTPLSADELSKLPMESTRMAMCILAIGPMLFIFPFFQKYFTAGLTVGSVKG